jgi:hypothetical protein
MISAQRLGGPAMAVAARLKRDARDIQTLIRSLKTIGSGRIHFMYLCCGHEALAGCLSSTIKTQLKHSPTSNWGVLGRSGGDYTMNTCSWYIRHKFNLYLGSVPRGKVVRRSGFLHREQLEARMYSQVY